MGAKSPLECSVEKLASASCGPLIIWHEHHDKIAGEGRAAGPCGRHPGPAALLAQKQPQEVHPAAAVQLPRPQDLFQDRLPRRRATPRRSPRPHRNPAPGAGPAFHDLTQGRRPAAQAAAGPAFGHRHRRPLPQATRDGATGRPRLDRVPVRPRQFLLRPPPLPRREVLPAHDLPPLRQAGGGRGLLHARHHRRHPAARAAGRYRPLRAAVGERAAARAAVDGPGGRRLRLEPNHRHAREVRGVRSFIPATAGRPTTKPPTGATGDR